MSSTINQTERHYAEEMKKQAQEKEKIMKEMGSEKSQFEIQMTNLTDKLQYLNQTIAAKTDQIVKLEQEKVQLADNLNQERFNYEFLFCVVNKIHQKNIFFLSQIDETKKKKILSVYVDAQVDAVPTLSDCTTYIRHNVHQGNFLIMQISQT